MDRIAAGQPNPKPHLCPVAVQKRQSLYLMGPGKLQEPQVKGMFAVKPQHKCKALEAPIVLLGAVAIIEMAQS